MQSKHLLIGLALAISTLLAGCSDPLKTPLPDDLAKMEAIKPQLEKLSEDDRKLLAGYLIRRTGFDIFKGLAKDTPALTAATVGEAIDAQRKFNADQQERDAAEKLAQAQAKVKQDAAVKAMREMVSVFLLDKTIETEKGYSGIELDRKIKISFEFKNNSAKDIAGVKGLIEIRDLFGDEISSFQISNDDTIKVGSTIKWSGSRSVKYAMGGNKDEKLADLGRDKYTLVWLPQAIVFTDGTKAEMPK